MSNMDLERMHDLMDSTASLTRAERKELSILQDEYTEREQAAFGQNLACFINN